MTRTPMSEQAWQQSCLRSLGSLRYTDMTYSDHTLSAHWWSDQPHRLRARTQEHLSCNSKPRQRADSATSQSV